MTIKKYPSLCYACIVAKDAVMLMTYCIGAHKCDGCGRHTDLAITMLKEKAGNV